jgi:hypothetical protein
MRRASRFAPYLARTEPPARGRVGRRRASCRAGGGRTREKDDVEGGRAGFSHLDPFSLPLFSLTGRAPRVRCLAQPTTCQNRPPKPLQGVICTVLQSLGGSLSGLIVGGAKCSTVHSLGVCILLPIIININFFFCFPLFFYD